MPFRLDALVWGALLWTLGAHPICAQYMNWTKSTSAHLSWEVAFDESGNAYYTGEFSDTTDFDPGLGVYHLIPVGAVDIFVLKLDSNGDFVWATQVGGTGNDFVGQIAVGESGNVYVSGRFWYTADFDPGPGVYNLVSLGLADNFVQKLDSNGNLKWAISVGNPLNDSPYSILPDGAGQVYLSGVFMDTADFDPGVPEFLIASQGGWDSFVEKFDSLGNMVWVRTFGGAGSEWTTSSALDPSGNIYSVGTYSGTVDFDPGLGITNLTCPPEGSYFVQKIDPFGDLVWAINGTEGWVSPWKVDCDADGNVIVAGDFSDTVDFDPGSGISESESQGMQDFFVQKFNSAGDYLWAAALGGSLDDNANCLEADVMGNVYVGGYFEGEVDFDHGPGTFLLNSLADPDLFVLKMDQAGHFIWAKGIGGGGSASAQGISSDDAGFLHLTGYYQGTVDFDPGSGVHNLVSGGWYNNAFFAKWGQDSCSDFTLLIDSVKDISCSTGMGFISGTALNGTGSTSYLWYTTPASVDSFVIVSSPGIYHVTLTDSIGCFTYRDILVNGPLFPGGFDIDVDAWAVPFRPGESSSLFVDVLNSGCLGAGGVLSLVVPPLLTYSGGFPLPTSISGDTLSYLFPTLTYDSTHFLPTLEFTVSTSASIGDTVCFDMLLSPIAGDSDPSNNAKRHCFPIVSSYDPNDKLAYPPGLCPEHYVQYDQKITYTIRFQNTGTADAINVHILDTISDGLDLGSIRVKSYSHPMHTEVLPGRRVKFIFDDIHLPDSTSNEPQSHGYIVYEIYPAPSALPGTEVNNRGHIFFDYNPPVATNFVFHTITDSIPCIVVSNSDPKSAQGLAVYPNPVDDILMISTNEPIHQISLLNLLGEVMIRVDIAGQLSHDLDLTSQSAGIYLLSAETDGGVSIAKVVIY